MNKIEKSLLSEIEKFTIIDAHEHLYTEAERSTIRLDVFSNLIQYVRQDLVTAGMPEEDVASLGYAVLKNPTLPLEDRWEKVSKYLPLVENGSFYRPIAIALKEFYGIEHLDATNYREVSEKIQANNRHGIYKKILKEKCHIKYVLNLNPYSTCDDPNGILLELKPILALAGINGTGFVEEIENKYGSRAQTLDTYLQTIEKALDTWKEQGAVGIKMSSEKMSPCSMDDAKTLFGKLMKQKSYSENELTPFLPLRDFLKEFMIEKAGERKLTIAVHTGLRATVWDDVRKLHPEHILEVILRHRNTRFDLFHGGMPWIRFIAIMAKQSPNVYLNLCWSHITSPEITKASISEWLDLIPVNKILAFGGDYWLALENVFGHLVVARENIAKVLASRIENHLMSEEKALKIARMWFYNNAFEAYPLMREF